MAIYITKKQISYEKLRAENSLEIIDLSKNFSEQEKTEVKECLNKLITIYSKVLAEDIKVKFESL